MVFHLKRLVKREKGQGEGTDTNLDYSCTIEKAEKNLTFAHTYSVVGFDTRLERFFLQPVLSYYIPSFIIVLVSWINFVIPPEIIPGRMGMLVTLLLVLVNLFGSIIHTQPPSKSPTFLAIWIIACICFVAMALFSYAFLLSKLRHQVWETLTDKTNPENQITPVGQRKTEAKTKEYEVDASLYSMNPPYLEQHKMKMEAKKDNDQDTMRLYTMDWDKKCLLVFSSSYLLFNLIYWPIILFQRSYESEYYRL